jgi:hypothetical protein
VLDDPNESANWYASATYAGVRIGQQHHPNVGAPIALIARNATSL